MNILVSGTHAYAPNIYKIRLWIVYESGFPCTVQMWTNNGSLSHIIVRYLWEVYRGDFLSMIWPNRMLIESLSMVEDYQDQSIWLMILRFSVVTPFQFPRFQIETHKFCVSFHISLRFYKTKRVLEKKLTFSRIIKHYITKDIQETS